MGLGERHANANNHTGQARTIGPRTTKTRAPQHLTHPGSPMPRRALAPTLLLLGSLVLTAACSTGSPPADSAPSPDDPSRTGGNDTGTQVDLTKLKGVNIVSDSSIDRSCPWATSYPDVPGTGAMTAVMKKDVRGRLAGFLGEDIGGPPNCGGADGSEGPELGRTGRTVRSPAAGPGR